MSAQTVKGSHVFQLKNWVDNHLGPGEFPRMTRHGGENWSVVLPVSWYDVEIVNDVMKQASRRTGTIVEEISTEVCRLNAERDLTTLYRFFLRVARPQRVLEHAPKIWRTYVAFGEARAIHNEKGHYIGQGDGFSEDLVPWACGSWLGFVPTAISRAGGHRPNAKILKRWRETNGYYSFQIEVKYT